MGRLRSWKKNRVYRPELLLQQLEERIVLDAAVNPAPQDNPSDNPSNPQDHVGGLDTSPAADAAAAGGAGGGNAGLVAQLPDSFNHVFSENLNVVLISNNLADVQAISNAAPPDAKVIVFDAANDNLATVTSMLQDVVNSEGHKIDNLAIVGHGTLGNLVVGTDQIQFVSLANYSATFEALGQTLSQDAQIQFYGCSIAGDGSGQAMFDSIALYTTADTFASTDTTGGSAHDWTLEYASSSTVAMHSVLNVDSLAADSTSLVGPELVKDIDTSSGSSATSFVAMGGKTYFVASDGLHQNNIWVYDPAGAGTTTLLQAAIGTYNSATNLTVVGSQLFFSANGVGGTELWVTDGTDANTHMVKDIAPNSSGTPENLRAFDGKLFFSASTNFDPPSGAVINKELWVSDGTEAGTKLVKEINPSTTGTASGSNPSSFTQMGNTLFFWANDGANNGELWKSTPNGGVDNPLTTDVDESYTTQMVADIYPGGSGSPSNLTVFNDGVHGDKLYFTATNATYGRELWSTDGTNTVMVKDILPGTGAGLSSAQLTVVDNGVAGSARLYFVAIYDGTGFNQHGYEVWSTASSGVADNLATTTLDESMTTLLVRDVNTNIAPPGTTTPTNLTAFNHKLYFTETDGTGAGQHGVELWSTDGTFAGTTMVQDIYAGTGSSNPSNLTVFNGKLYFTASEPTGLARGTELWATDGTTTDVVLDINVGTGSSSPSNLTVSGGKLYFSASDGTAAGLHGTELWATDGTTTAMVEDINPGTASSSLAALKDVGGKLLFTATDGATGVEPWVSDGTPGGTHIIEDINLGGLTPQGLVNLNGTLYFAASDTVHGLELWKSDGTALGTTMVTNNPDQDGIVGVPTVVNGTLYFLGKSSGTTDSQLFKLDANGTPVSVINMVANGADDITSLTGVNNTLYFIKTAASTGFPAGIYGSDGTFAGTAPVVSQSGIAITGPANLTNVNGSLFFTGTSGTTGNELYWVNPATGKSVIVADLASSGSSSPSNLTNVGGTLYFTATVSGVTSLYTSNGTSITLVNNGVGVPVTGMQNFTNVNGTLFFTGTATGFGNELFYVDAAGTIRVVDIVTGGTGSSPTDLYNANGKLLFAATDAANGRELWTADSATGAANLLKDINSGPAASSSPSSFAYFNGLTYFKATDATGGTELWQTNGIDAAGTTIVGDIYPGTGSSSPANLVGVNNTLFFVANGVPVGGVSPSGTEVWKVGDLGTNTIPTATLMNQDYTPTPLSEGSLALNLQDIVIIDNDLGDTITANLSLNKPAAGVLSTAGTIATYNAATGFWQASGTLADVNSALAAVDFTPNPDWNGTVNITTHVQDAKVTGPANGLITIVATAVNDAPITSDLAPSSAEDTSVIITGWTFDDSKDQVAGGSTANNPVSVTIVDLPLNGTLSNNGVALIAGAIVPWADVIGGLVTFQPDANWNGSTSFHFTVQDDGGTANFGQDTSLTATANVTVTAVNDAPVNTAPASVTVNEDVLTPIGIQIADVDASTVQVTLSVNQGTLLVNDAVIGGLTALDITGNGSGNVVLNGTLAAINATLLDAAGLQYLSILNYNGPDTLTVLTSDLGATGSGGTLTDTDLVAITVTPVNDAPVNTVNPVNVPANASTTISLAGGLTVHDADIGETLFVDVKAGTGVTGLGWGTGTTFAPEYVFMGTEGYLNTFLNGLKAQVSAGFSGPATVLITTTDLNGLSDTDTLTITFDGPTSSAPVITTDVVGFTVNEDNGGLPVGLGTHVSVSDVNGDPLTVDLTASAGWSGLNATASGGAVVTGGGTAALHITGSMVDVQNTLATLAGTLITDFNGTATFGVTVSDGINPPVTSPPVDIPIIAVNDAPVNAVPVSATRADEDVLTPITGILISDVDAGASAVQVTLSVANGTLQANDTVVGGLTAAGITGNGTGSVVLNGTLAEINATLADATGLQYLSVLNYNGSDTLTVLSDDLGATGTPGAQTDSDPVAITVDAVNDAPVNTVPVSAIADTNVLTPITGILISDVDADPSAVQVTLSVANGTLLVNEGVVGGLTAADITGNASGSVVLNGTLAAINATLADATGLRYLSSLDYVGPDTLTVLTNDQGATGSGGAQTDSDPVAITVNNVVDVNDPPVINLSAVVQQTDPSGAVIFNAANNNLISVSDVDAGTGLVKLTLTATHGTMTLSGVTGLTFDPGQDGTADATMSFTGTVADINTALNGMSFNRDAGYTGLADVTIGVNDQGNTGTGGPQVANVVENISVEPYDVWFAGFGTEAGWDVYNYTANGDVYYTHDMTLYWQHVNATDTWNFFNGTAWVSTDALGNAPYDGGYGPPNDWFGATTGPYNGYDVYIHTAGQATYFSLDHTAAGATYWQVTGAGAWSYFDGSAWYATAGFNVEPVNVWFHGYAGTDAGWDVYNYSANGDEYFTHNQTVFWWHVVTGDTWQYFNGTAWLPTTGLGVVV